MKSNHEDDEKNKNKNKKIQEDKNSGLQNQSLRTIQNFKNYKTYLYWFFKNDHLLSKCSLLLSFKLNVDSKLGESIFSFSPSFSIFYRVLPLFSDSLFLFYLLLFSLKMISSPFLT